MSTPESGELPEFPFCEKCRRCEDKGRRTCSVCGGPTIDAAKAGSDAGGKESPRYIVGHDPGDGPPEEAASVVMSHAGGVFTVEHVERGPGSRWRAETWAVERERARPSPPVSAAAVRSKLHTCEVDDEPCEACGDPVSPSPPEGKPAPTEEEFDRSFGSVPEMRGFGRHDANGDAARPEPSDEALSKLYWEAADVPGEKWSNVQKAKRAVFNAGREHERTVSKARDGERKANAPCGCDYGPAPHKCFYKIPGAGIGQSVTLPREEWPANFREDPDAPGCGTYTCEKHMAQVSTGAVEPGHPSPTEPADEAAEVREMYEHCAALMPYNIPPWVRMSGSDAPELPGPSKMWWTAAYRFVRDREAARQTERIRELTEQSEYWRRAELAWQAWAGALLTRLGLQPPGGQWGDVVAREKLESELAVAKATVAAWRPIVVAAERATHHHKNDRNRPWSISQLAADVDALPADKRPGGTGSGK